MSIGLLPFFILLTAGLIFSELFKKFELPYSLSLIVAGIIIGPVLNLIPIDETITLVAAVGIIFLMFMAGNEVKLKNIRYSGNAIFIISALNGAIPFATGFFIGHLFGYGIQTSLVLGIVFISSSVAILVPMLDKLGLMKERLGQVIMSSAVFEDIGSMILLSILLQTYMQTTTLPIPIYIPTLIVIILLMKTILPKIEKRYHSKKRGRDLFESELRFIFITLLATVILFEVLGMHSIVAGFIIGIILSDSIKGKIREKVHTISYGFFIPIFFLILGMNTDIFVLGNLTNVLLTITIIIGLILSKIISGYIGGRLTKFSKKESMIIGVATVPQLSTTLAVAYTATAFGIIGHEIMTSLIVLSFATTAFAPITVNILVKRLKK